MARVHMLPLSIAPDGTDVVLWKQISSWLAHTASVLEADAQSETGKFKQVDLKWMGQAASVLKGELEGKSPLACGASAVQLRTLQAVRKVFCGTVFCHNDINSGNVLVPAEGGQVHFIDWEYAGANPAGFDIGNHWCEYAGFDFEHGLHHFPDHTSATMFLKAYVAARCPEVLQGLDEELFWEEGVRLCNGYALASHLLWGTWSMVQGAFSTVDFDFVQYGLQRLRALEVQRAQFGLPPLPSAGAAAAEGNSAATAAST